MHAVLLHVWLLNSGLFVVAAVLAFNFLGDGLRATAVDDDAASQPR